MEEPTAPFLIVGLGNPGPEYNLTRHNLGFQVIETIAHKNGVVWNREGALKGLVGKARKEQRLFFLLKPMVFMNNSGESVALTRRYYQVPVHRILVISDDIALPFTKMRLSDKGSSGGHRGLESVELMLGTQHYARLRIGIGDRNEGELADYVLGRFTEEEQKLLPPLIERAAKAVEIWMGEGSEAARQALLPEVNGR
ncbi:MAG: aminoacyl-tRNA hydrolase [Simkania sp.]|nr:aminoacyl-tRNA hydrolase [Simkania sp.]